MVPLSVLLAWRDTVNQDYWIGHCEGFRVSESGADLGVVEYVRYGSDHRRPDALGVRGGLLRSREFVVPTAQVDVVDVRFRTVFLRGERSADQRLGPLGELWLRVRRLTSVSVASSTV
jgi:hypothetical protein